MDVSRFAPRVPGLVRRSAKTAFRSFGVATNGMRALPGYLLIGAHRAGTSSLYQYLLQHPCVASNFPSIQRIKGVRFFDQHFAKGIPWYRSHFPTTAYLDYLEYRRGHAVIAGEASTYYLFHPRAAVRAARVVPEARIIVLLRNPIDRAYSHWRRERRDAAEPLATFEEAVAAERERLAGEEPRILADDAYYSYAHENFSYITQGLYLEPLTKWIERYSRARVCVELSEAFLADPQPVYDRILRFLGLPPFQLPDCRRWNTIPGAQGLSAATRDELRARLAPANRRLADYLGIELGWD